MADAILAGSSGYSEAIINFNNYISDNLVKITNGEVDSALCMPLSTARKELSATANNNYALFGGGRAFSTHPTTGVTSWQSRSIVDAYDISLTRTTPSGLTDSRYDIASSAIGDYALFGGGNRASSGFNNLSNIIDAYDDSLIRTAPPSPLPQASCGIAASSIGDHTLFGGGYINSSESISTTSTYNSSLIRLTITSLSEARGSLSATTIGNYVLFGGGGDKISSPVYSAIVDVYDSSLTKIMAQPLSVARNKSSATSAGKYALFAGGFAAGYHNVVDVYDSSLTKSIAPTLSNSDYGLASITIYDHAFFSGGGRGGASGIFSNVINVYDTSLVRTMPSVLSEARDQLAATSIGDYALFGGGYNDTPDVNTTKATVDSYIMQTINKTCLELPLGSKYKFTEHSSEQVSTEHSILINSPATGYIKYKKGVIS